LHHNPPATKQCIPDLTLHQRPVTVSDSSFPLLSFQQQ
jgi:hypothetical protein